MNVEKLQVVKGSKAAYPSNCNYILVEQNVKNIKMNNGSGVNVVTM